MGLSCRGGMKRQQQPRSLPDGAIFWVCQVSDLSLFRWDQRNFQEYLSSNLKTKTNTMYESRVIDTTTCTKCELCVKICPAGIIEKSGNSEISFRQDHLDICRLYSFFMHQKELRNTRSMHIFICHMHYLQRIHWDLEPPPSDLIGPAVNQSTTLRAMFQIPAGNEVVETLILGYPKLKFKHAIVRPRKKVFYVS